MVLNSILLIFLIPCVITDFRTKKVSLLWSSFWGIGGIAYSLIFDSQTISELLYSVSIGFILLIISKVFQQCIGYGDGIVFFVLGIWLRFWNTLLLLIGSFMLSGIGALFLLVVKKKGRADRIPFIPFVGAAYIVLWILQ